MYKGNDMRTGTTNLPLHGGKAPMWLFGRMVSLAREIISLLVMEFEPQNTSQGLEPVWIRQLLQHYLRPELHHQ
jgi:hypothetical protein